jgi:hypothetical protein
VPLKRGPLFGSHQIMRSAFSPPKRTSSTSVMDARSAAASMSNLERQRHTAPRRAVGSTVKRTSRASDNVVITRPLRSAIGTPNLRSQAMLQVQLARGLNQLVRSIARTTRTGASSIALGAIEARKSVSSASSPWRGYRQKLNEQQFGVRQLSAIDGPDDHIKDSRQK